MVTMAQLWEQLVLAGIELSGIGVGSGTYGTADGAFEMLAEQGSEAITVAIICNEKNPLPGMRPESRQSKNEVPLAHKHPSICRYKIDRYPAYKMCVDLLGTGLKVGLTTGGGVHGTLSFLENVRDNNPVIWNELLNDAGDRFFAVINADLLELYLDQLQPILDAGDMSANI